MEKVPLETAKLYGKSSARNRQTLWKKFRSLNKLIKTLLRILKK
ncbi:hypothetical protein [Helicobacter pylori]|nr:hypothetical protein [Helicobacter pylori]